MMRQACTCRRSNAMGERHVQLTLEALDNIAQTFSASAQIQLSPSSAEELSPAGCQIFSTRDFGSPARYRATMQAAPFSTVCQLKPLYPFVTPPARPPNIHLPVCNAVIPHHLTNTSTTPPGVEFTRDPGIWIFYNKVTIFKFHKIVTSIQMHDKSSLQCQPLWGFSEENFLTPEHSPHPRSMPS